jgi:hypothetical protein
VESVYSAVRAESLYKTLPFVFKGLIISRQWIKSKKENSYAVMKADYAAVRCRMCRSQWPRGLRRGFVGADLLGLWVQIPPETWISVCCECCVLSGTGLFDWPITHPTLILSWLSYTCFVNEPLLWEVLTLYNWLNTTKVDAVLLWREWGLLMTNGALVRTQSLDFLVSKFPTNCYTMKLLSGSNHIPQLLFLFDVQRK